VEREFIVGNSCVRDIVLRRRDSGSKPGWRNDHMHMALVIEGGGMRGAYTAGMIDALARCGMNSCFDAIYGTSAGGFAAVMFGAGQARGSSWLYPDELSGRQFIDFGRLLKHVGPVICLQYLVEQVLTITRPLDFAGLKDLGVPIWLIATAADSMEPHALGNFETAEEWKAALRASASIPLLSGPPVRLYDRSWLDGAISEPLAVRRAFNDGATHVLALLSRAPSEARSVSSGTAALSALFVNSVYPAWGRSLRMRPEWQGAVLSVRDRLDRSIGTTPLLALRPVTSCGVYALTTDELRLREAVAAGSAAVEAAFLC
jgi:predicted patatin/cPLA2 family phospholipase